MIKKLRYLLVALAVFLAAELYLHRQPQTLRAPQDHWVHQIQPALSEKLIYEFKPEFDLTAQRKRDKPEGLFRIACLGDSHTHCTEVSKRSEKYPQLLEQHLNQTSLHPVEVLNFGVPDYTWSQQMEALKTKALEFKPDLVIVQNIEDLGVCNYLSPKYKRLNRLLHTSRLLSGGLNWLLNGPWGRTHFAPWAAKYCPELFLAKPGLLNTYREAKTHDLRSPKLVPKRYQYLIDPNQRKKYLQELKQLSQTHAFGVLITGFMSPEEQEQCQQLGLDVVSFAELLKGQELSQLGYKNTANHFNAQGSHVFAQGLKRWILQKYGSQK